MSADAYWPMVALVAWTAGVGYLAVKRRIAEIRTKQIPLQSIARPRDIASALNDTQATDNFNNLLQVPLLFYVWCLSITQLNGDHWLAVIFAWVYVGARIWHSVIQITHNQVLQRFKVWMLGNMILLVLWGISTVQLLYAS